MTLLILYSLTPFYISNQLMSTCSRRTMEFCQSMYSPVFVYKISVRSMNIDDGRQTNDRSQSPFTHFGKNSNGHNSATRQPIPFMFGSTVLGWGFRGRRIERHHFRLHQIQDGGQRPFWKKIKRPCLWNALSDSLYVWTQVCFALELYNDCWRILYDRRWTHFTRGTGN